MRKFLLVCLPLLLSLAIVISLLSLLCTQKININDFANLLIGTGTILIPIYGTLGFHYYSLNRTSDRESEYALQLSEIVDHTVDTIIRLNLSHTMNTKDAINAGNTIFITNIPDAEEKIKRFQDNTWKIWLFNEDKNLKSLFTSLKDKLNILLINIQLIIRHNINITEIDPNKHSKILNDIKKELPELKTDLLDSFQKYYKY